MSKKILKPLASLGIMSLVIITVLSANPVKASVGQVTRISGADRYATAAQVATSNWTTSDNVVLVSGERYSDAVSASELAKRLDAPILLTTADALDPNTSAALSSLEAKNVYVIGGNASISQDVRDSLKSKYKLTELGGANRYETNMAVATELVKLGVDPSNVMMVGGEGFSDALSVAPIASAKGQILLLANNDTSCMKPAIDFVTKNKSKVTVVGTTNVISDKMYNTVNGTSRVNGGTDRFDTNLKGLAAFSTTLNFNKVYIVNASNDGYADALVASAVAGKTGAPLVLLDSQTSQATANAIDYIKTNIPKTSDLNVIGGTGVVTNDTVDIINGIITGKPIVSFKDKNLEEAVRDSIDKPNGTLYKSDVEKITVLSAQDRGIKDISGIENLTNLQSLALYSNQISDISMVKDLTNLQELNLADNQISDISGLKDLTNLQTLYLQNNKISDINGLKDLTNLQKLLLENNEISDISALKGLTNLESLSLDDNKISDINMLKDLTNLQNLFLADNEISNISALKGVTSLQELYLDSNKISDISELNSLTNLQALGLSSNEISDIKGLKDLIILKFLDLKNNKISDVDKASLKNFLPRCTIIYE
ncbi:cell wall-binding repeat-containing protein [Clostridium sp. 001]|uniref:cell wall-binding repeat-containing protein n=1 Tax=Clostridium sp. 001 TaxID=1970093 RepID=UPI001C2C72DE|nr:cell wall-binding repeat-containing protein [Clostridium sp. 001]